MKALLIRFLQSSLTSLGAESAVLDAPPASEPARLEKPVAATVKARATDYVRTIEREHADKSGEWKRHQVIAKLMKDFPPHQKGDVVKLSRAIDDAVEKL